MSSTRKSNMTTLDDNVYSFTHKKKVCYQYSTIYKVSRRDLLELILCQVQTKDGADAMERMKNYLEQVASEQVWHDIVEKFIRVFPTDSGDVYECEDETWEDSQEDDEERDILDFVSDVDDCEDAIQVATDAADHHLSGYVPPPVLSSSVEQLRTLHKELLLLNSDVAENYAQIVRIQEALIKSRPEKEKEAEDRIAMLEEDIRAKKLIIADKMKLLE